MRVFRKLSLAVALGTAGAACCVAKGTRVRTRRGERLVEALEVGDEVTCVDPVTGARVSSTLTATRTAHRECVTLQTSRGVLRCTTDHPLYDPDSASWADAGDWVLGRRTTLVWVPEDDATPLERVVVQPGASVTLEQVFDLTVAHELHDFVANGLLVHNKSPPRPLCLRDGGAQVTPDCVCQSGFTPTATCDDVYVECGCKPNGSDAGLADGGVDGGP